MGVWGRGEISCPILLLTVWVVCDTGLGGRGGLFRNKQWGCVMRFSGFLLLGLSGCASFDCCQPMYQANVPYSPPVTLRAPVADGEVIISKPGPVEPVPAVSPSPFKDSGAPPLEPLQKEVVK